MGYEGLWVWRGMLKIDSKNCGKFVKNCRKNLGLPTPEHMGIGKSGAI
jgi:hypothetical protein